jgi:hypothetical protein
MAWLIIVIMAWLIIDILRKVPATYSYCPLLRGFMLDSKAKDK